MSDRPFTISIPHLLGAFFGHRTRSEGLRRAQSDSEELLRNSEKKTRASKASVAPRKIGPLPTRTVKVFFAELEARVPRTPGLYEIHTHSGVALKVGIAVNLLKRLKSHRASRDSGLHWKKGADKTHPDHVESKSSILAKHLYFDSSLAAGLDMKTQAGRRRFLAEHCYVRVQPMSREDALKAERIAEAKKQFRYVGLVQIR